eukprot:scaffold159463_cov28-Attheya_sp.AAC.2
MTTAGAARTIAGFGCGARRSVALSSSRTALFGLERRSLFQQASAPTANHSTGVTLSSSRYWNREESSTPRKYSQSSEAPMKEAKIICLSGKEDSADSALCSGENLPDGASILAIGESIDDFDLELLKEQKPNVLFVSHAKARKPLGKLLQELPSLEWVHSRSAGIDYITSPELSSSTVTVTNAKGQFSSTLAEYTMMACSYFAKDLPRLIRQKNEKSWSKYNVEELRGSTLGVV